MMMNIKCILAGWLFSILGGLSVSAFTTSDANTAFTAYNSAFAPAGGYPGWWTGAEEIEMTEDAYDALPTLNRQIIVLNACNQFLLNHGSNWTAAGPFFNKFNDDIAWAVLAFTRGYLITGNSNFLSVAKNNWDAMYARAWETNFTGGGLWWNTDNMYKNAAVNGPAAIGACMLYQIYGDASYLDKAKAIYAWERQVLFNTGNGAIADGINTNSSINFDATTYNQGTFIGAANLLYRITGLPYYYQDAMLAGKFTQNNMSSAAGIMPEYSSNTDLSGFNGIFARWMGRFARDQDVWPSFGPWLTTNANAAWSIRNTNNLAWQKWATPMGTNAAEAWGCSAAVVIMHVADPNPGDALQVTPSRGFTVAAQHTLNPGPASTILVLTNTSGAPLSWSLANSSSWVSVSASSGTLVAGAWTGMLVSLIPSAATNLPAGRHYAAITITNVSSGAVQTRFCELVISAGNAPIKLTGYNARAMARNTATAGTPTAGAFDIPNNYSLYQAGLNGSTRGLPPDGVFTSLSDETSVFQFAYGETNTLMLGYTFPSSATLTLATPKTYNSVSILACSANGGGTGTLVFNFTNGTQSQVFSFNAQDWFNNTNNVAIKGIGRLKLTGSFGAEDNGANNPNLYQTTIDLEQLGLNQPIASITFTKPAGAGAQQTTGIFAVSGEVTPDAPYIIQQPLSLTVTNTQAAAVFSVFANGAPSLKYQWYFSTDGSPGTYAPLGNQTNASLQVNPPLQTTNSGKYLVVVTNGFGSVTSSVANLNVVPIPAYPYGQLVIADAPLGYWKLDETNGSVAYDYVSDHDGVYTLNVLLGQPGHGLVDTHKAAGFGTLANSNSCVTNINLDFATSSNASFTVEAWVKGGAQTTDAGLVSKGYGSGGEQFNLDCGSGGSHAFRFFVRNASGGVHLANSSVVPNNQWQHVVGVCDQINGNVYLYVNGTNVGSGSIGTSSGLLSSTTPVSIGARKSGAGTAYDFQFVGSMEEVAIYGYALSPAQVQAHYVAASNRVPGFMSNPFFGPNVIAGQSVAGTVGTQASDPNGDTLTYVKVSGPGWLNIASNGNLTGSPVSANVGTNVFQVSASDPGGLSATATMNVVVSVAPPIYMDADLQGNQLILGWSGGVAPYQVQIATNMANPTWQNLGGLISSNNLFVLPTNSEAYYRILGQ